MAKAIPNRWKDFRTARRALKRSFPDRATRYAVEIESWLWRGPPPKSSPLDRSETCPMCGRALLDDTMLVVTPRSAIEGESAMRRMREGLPYETIRPPRTDLEFRRSGIGMFERMHVAPGSLICVDCVNAASHLQREFEESLRPDPDLVWADTVRALAADGAPRAILQRLEKERRLRVQWKIEAARCTLCRRDRTCFALPWHAICDDCLTKAAAVTVSEVRAGS